MKLLLTILCSLWVFSPAAAAGKRKPAAEPVPDIRMQIKEMKETLDQLEAEMEVVKSQTRILAQTKRLGFLDRFYGKAGLSMISPRQRTLDFNGQTGLGVFAGLGHYLGRNHVIDISFDWDLYPSLSIRYRFEMHSRSPALSFGPVIGFKTRAAELRPLDDFLESPERLKSSFFMFGFLVGFPLEHAMVTLELLYLTNQQAFLFLNGGMHFFF